MNIIDMHLLMDEGLGVRPEILLLNESNNFLSIRISKEFKGVRFYHQFNIAHPAINKRYAEQLTAMFALTVESLQGEINQKARN